MQVRTPDAGLGAYPRDPWYDPNRPSWLPYWIDTPTEFTTRQNWALVKAGFYPGVTEEQLMNPSKAYPPPPVVTPVVPGNIVTSGPGAVEEVYTGTWDKYKREMQAFFAALGQKSEADAEREKTGIPMWVWLAGGGVLAVVLLSRR